MLSPETLIPAFKRLTVFIVPGVLGIVCHEVAHGWVAWRLGDPTAHSAGRLTLNPAKHVDPTGTVVLVMTALFTNFVIGWAKPVPVQPRYFKNPRVGMMLVSAAGPMTNLILAILFAVVFKLLLGPLHSTLPAEATRLFLEIAHAGIWINCVLAIFNLMPVPPLDGSHIVSGFMPREMVRAYWGLGRYSMILIIALVATGAFSKIVLPVVRAALHAICMIVGINPQYFQ